jgi:YegS/Rv2252/BmrU family lipid kinase
LNAIKKLLFVMNPFAGTKKANRYLPEIITLFNRADYEVTAYMTAGPGDAARMVAEKAGEMDLIVCAGGDGTFNETVSGVLRSGADVPVGYIPAGSTNDFATSLHLPVNILQAAQLIVEGEAQYYDVGSFNDRYFTYVASFGAFTRASYATPQNVKNALGHTAYLLGGIQELSQIRNSHVRLELDDGRIIEDDFIFGTISNSTSVGGILTLDPKQVDMRDGKFEVLLVRAPKDLLEVTDCIRALTEQKYNCAMITFLSASEIRVTADPEMTWTLDGERADGAAVINIDNRHHAIRLICERNEE